jgi:hypothetical protein
MLQQAKIKSRAHVHVPKLLGLLINRVLKRREISLDKHGEIISKTLQVLNTLAWHCPSHLLHKYARSSPLIHFTATPVGGTRNNTPTSARFEPLFTTNLLFSFLGRTTSLPIKELTVDILLNLFRSTCGPVVCWCSVWTQLTVTLWCVWCRLPVPSYLPMLKKTANGGLTLLDRAIKYLGAEQYDPAEV